MVDAKVTLLGAEEWTVLKQVRIKALTDDPKAFVADLDAELAWTDDQWRHLVRQDRWAVARSAGEVIALAGATSATVEGRPGPHHLQSVWVDPDFREEGVASELIRRLVEHAHQNGERDIRVWVIESNRPARRLYEKLGFQMTDDRQRVSEDDERIEVRLRLANLRNLTN